MNRAAQIRDYLRAHATEEAPLWPCEVAAGIPCPEGVERAKHTLSVCHTLHVMHQGGFVGKKQEGGGRYRYWLIRDPVAKPLMDPEERRRRKNAKERMRMRVKGNRRPLAEYLAQRRADAAARKARIAAERAARDAEKAAARERKALEREQAAVKQPNAHPKPEPRPVPVPKSPSATRPAEQQPSVIRVAPSPKPAPKVRVESVKEFIARGGRIQQVAAGVVSKPVLRFPPIDFRKQAA